MAWWSRKRTTPALDFRREGGSAPRDHDILTVADDGSFSMWRTVGRSTQPPSAIGRFAGAVPPERWAALSAALEQCRRADPIELSLPADAAREKVVFGKRVSTWADDAVPPAPYAALAVESRRLLSELTEAPEAAVGISAGDPPELHHLGSDPLEIDLSGATVRAVRWEGGRVVEDWHASIDGPRSVSISKGWRLRLPSSHGFGRDAEVSFEVNELLAFDGEFWRSCALTSR